MKLPFSSYSKMFVVALPKTGPPVADVPGWLSTTTCPLELTATASTSPRFLSGVIFKNGTDSYGRSGTSCCASAGLVSSTSKATIKSRFIEPPKSCNLRSNLRNQNPTDNELGDMRRSDRGAHIVSRAFRNLTQSTPRKATEYTEGSCM